MEEVVVAHSSQLHHIEKLAFNECGWYVIHVYAYVSYSDGAIGAPIIQY